MCKSFFLSWLLLSVLTMPLQANIEVTDSHPSSRLTDCNGFLKVEASGTAGPFEVSIAGQDQVITGVNGSITITGLCNGTYEIFVTPSAYPGCTTLLTHTLGGGFADWDYTELLDGCDNANQEQITLEEEETALLLSLDGCHFDSGIKSRDRRVFAHTELCGDGQITARSREAETTDRTAFGLSIRNSSAANAKTFDLYRFDDYGDTDHYKRGHTRYVAGHDYQYEEDAHDETWEWTKLERQGDGMRGYVSSDGINWSLYLVRTLPLENCVRVGLFVHQRQQGIAASALFSRVSVTPLTATASQFPALPASPIEPSTATGGELIAFPNPTSGLVSARLTLDRRTARRGENIHLALYDTQGKLVHYDLLKPSRNNTSLEQTIDLSPLPAGPYFLHAFTNETSLGSQRILLR